MGFLLRAVLAFALAIFSLTPALADTRVALVIANAGYKAVPRLPNPANDGPAVATALRAAGFTTVTVLSDLDQQGMRRALQTFAGAARDADVAVVYYAGHGMEMGGVNYLLPVDARLATNGDVQFEAVPLDLVMQAVGGARRLGLVMLDACRNNPFAAGMQMTGGATRAVGRGLSRVEPLNNTLVVFAAREGTTADDGTGDHSPFAAALIRRLPSAGVEVSLLFRQVRDDVLRDTANRQQPFVYGSLGGDPLYFVPPIQVATAVPAYTPPRPASVFAPAVQNAVDAAMRAELTAKTAAEEGRLAQASAVVAAAKARDAEQKAERKVAGYFILTGSYKDNAGVTHSWRYAGQAKDGKAEGYGVNVYQDGERQEGQWVNDLRHGFVIVRFADKSSFEGVQQNGVRVRGVERYADGDDFSGTYIEGARQYGVYTGGPTRNYTTKAGQWVADKLAGFAVLHWRDGRTLTGQWTADNLDGAGAEVSRDGQVIGQGLYANGALKTAMTP